MEVGEILCQLIERKKKNHDFMFFFFSFVFLEDKERKGKERKGKERKGKENETWSEGV